MSTDPFLRQRINELTGLTVYGQKSGLATVVSPSTWTPLDIQSLTVPLKDHLVLTAFKITTDVGDFVMRMSSGVKKIFPHGASVEVLSGVDMFLQFKIQLPIDTDFSIEVFSPTGGTATLDYLSLIEIEGYNFT